MLTDEELRQVTENVQEVTDVPVFRITDAEFHILTRSKKSNAKLVLYLEIDDDDEPDIRTYAPLVMALGALTEWAHRAAQVVLNMINAVDDDAHDPVEESKKLFSIAEED